MNTVGKVAALNLQNSESFQCHSSPPPLHFQHIKGKTGPSQLPALPTKHRGSFCAVSSKTDPQSSHRSGAFISVLTPGESKCQLLQASSKGPVKLEKGWRRRRQVCMRLWDVPYTTVMPGLWNGLNLALENCSLGKLGFDPGKRESCLGNQKSFKVFRVRRQHRVVFKRTWAPTGRRPTSGFSRHLPGCSILSPEPLLPQLENAVHQYLQVL